MAPVTKESIPSPEPLDSLLRRSLAQIELWQRTYGEHTPSWLPPAGDVRLAEDIHEALKAPMALVYRQKEGPIPQKPSNGDLRTLWKAAGGQFHGPNVETGTMPEAALLPFLRGLLNGNADRDSVSG